MTTLENVYGARRATEVCESTWGHLRPGVGRHPGCIIAACSIYGGERLVVSADFDAVPDSPWLYEAICDLVNDADLSEGAVHRFNGALLVSGGCLRFEGYWTRTGSAL